MKEILKVVVAAAIIARNEIKGAIRCKNGTLAKIIPCTAHTSSLFAAKKRIRNTRTLAVII